LLDTRHHEALLVQQIKNSCRGLGRRDCRNDAGTDFSIAYEKAEDNRLIASMFSARKVQDETCKVSFPHFLSLAWAAANEKAREIGWIR
jgi:hypothetical protein